jgi:hypothetical protein
VVPVSCDGLEYILTNRPKLLLGVAAVAVLCAITFIAGQASVKKDNQPAFSSTEELAYLAQTASFTLEAYDQLDLGGTEQARRKLLLQLADTFKFLRESGSLPRAANALCPRLSRIQKLAERLANNPGELRDEPEHSRRYVLGELNEIVAAAQPICQVEGKK